MRLTTLRLIAPLALAGILSAETVESQQIEKVVPAEVVPALEPSFWQAAGGVVAANGLTWAYNWYVQRWGWSNVGTRAWLNNLRDGFVWDDDAFLDNQLAHPYHGSLYHNAARGSGYGFWASTPFVVAGSLGWELLSENIQPSLNDLINTTLGGIALGEVTFRLSSLLASSPRSGGGMGLGRGAGAFLLSPMGRTQALLNGKGRDAAISSQARMQTSTTWISVGRRREVIGVGDGAAEPQSFVRLRFDYGSPFARGALRPYDAFDFSLEFSPQETGVITHAAVSGLLARRTLHRSARSEMHLGLFQNFDYEQMPGFKASSQSVSGALLFRRQTARGAHLVLGAHLEVVPLGAVLSDHNRYRHRDYDYGPGLAGRFTGSLQSRGRDLLRVDTRVLWVHSVYGADADHFATTAQVSAMLPVMRMLGVGADVGLAFRRSVYQHKPRLLDRIPRLRAYLVWSPS
jgi:hypothetical protein